MIWKIFHVVYRHQGMDGEKHKWATIDDVFERTVTSYLAAANLWLDSDESHCYKEWQAFLFFKYVTNPNLD